MQKEELKDIDISIFYAKIKTQLICKFVLGDYTMKFKKTVVAVMILVLCLLTVTSCGTHENKKVTIDSSKKTVAVSIVPEKTFVKAVCGDLVNIVTMIPPGFSPENYEPTPQEIAVFEEADVYFTMGVPAEENSILPSVGKETRVVHLEEAVAEKYPDLKLGTGRDPHIWMSPKRVIVMIRTIVDEMVKLDAANKNTYLSNGENYIKQLEALDQELQTSLEKISDKKMLVFHPAFGYFAYDYGIMMVALEEEGKEATAEHIQEMIDLAKAEKIKAIFYQEEMSSAQAKSFAEEIGGKTVMLEPLAESYIENLKLMANTIVEAMK